MKRILIILIWTLCSAIQIMAIPADSKPQSVVQADGTTLTIRLHGDETYHFFATIDDQVVVQDGKGTWYYANYSEIGEIQPSSMMAHNIGMRDSEEMKFLNEREKNGITAVIRQHISRKWTEMCSINNMKRMNRVAQRLFDSPGQYKGKKHGLVILVEFANLNMASSNSRQEYERRFNEKGYTQDGHVGSVSDYFRDQSYGAFEISFDIVGPVKMSRNYGYYGTDGAGNRGHDQHADEMIREACCLADPYVNFKDYDWNNDGEVDQVYIIYAGYGQATGGPSNSIWPHESQLMYYKDGTIKLDGTTINTYACSNELYGDNRERYMGIGTACHEFSHCLGLPDTYDTDYSGAFGMSYWGVMNSGSYSGPNGRGEVPCGYTAFERWYVGWLEMKDITFSQWIKNLPDLERFPIAYRLRSENTYDEYYILENRQGTKWFSYVDQKKGLHGMLITHIDYDESAWHRNEVNISPSRQRMTIIPADGNYDQSTIGLVNDLFPGSNEVTFVNNTSHYECGGKLNNPNADGTFTMNTTISEIEENKEDGTISLCVVLNRDLAIPKAYDAIWYPGKGIHFQWGHSFGAVTYDVQVLKVISNNPLQTERQEITGIRDEYYDFDISDYRNLLLRVRSRRGSICSEWSNIVTAEALPEGILHTNIVDNTDINYYNIKGQLVQKGSIHGIVIKNLNKSKYIQIR